MKQHHTKYKKNYREYILSTVEDDGWGNELKEEQEKINHIFDRFKSEYGWMIERVGERKAMSEWLQGLALPIAFYNSDIIKLAVDMGSIDSNPSEKLQDKVTENYWDFMANIILEIEKDSLIKLNRRG